MKFVTQKNIIIAASGILLLGVFGFIFFYSESGFDITGKPQLAQIDQGGTGLKGVNCDNATRRPVAVMYASDPVARPLYGLGQADMVFEMPVTPGGVTRMMAVFQCSSPSEIGSVRSSRKEFIPLAASIGALYAHWGGEREALDSLNNGIINNIDAMKYEGTTFYRKPKTKAPHNGFTTFDKLFERAGKLGYSLSAIFSGYPHAYKEGERSLSNIANTVSIPYTAPYDVTWTYNSGSRTYERRRDGKPETDGLTGEIVQTSVIAVVRTGSTPINEFYQDVDLIGEGEAVIYQEGVSMSGKWQKGPEIESKLKFLDAEGKEINFTPGVIWVEIITQ